MIRYRGLIPALVILSLGAAVTLARPGSTAPSRSSATLPVGFVDIDEVAEKSVVGQNAQNEAKALQKKLQDQLDKKQQVALLTPEQQSELEKLQAKTQTSDAEKARIAELTGATAKLEKELMELQTKTTPTAEESNRIKELTSRKQSAIQRLSGDVEKAQIELRENGAQIMRSLQERIMKAVEETARAEGLAMVVHKEARLYGGVDITDAVVSRLKK
jgi:Skp family chaperone for outer membrane proteins